MAVSRAIVERAQVVQKVLFSYTIYYTSAWLMANYQANKIEKALRHFLWSDGLGNSKRHNVKWEWCCIPKKLGGLGMRDVKKQGISLATKWVLKSLEGCEPWKILIRNNIGRAIVKKSKQWVNIPLMDIILEILRSKWLVLRCFNLFGKLGFR